jgi:hypothetical protein
MPPGATLAVLGIAPIDTRTLDSHQFCPRPGSRPRGDITYGVPGIQRRDGVRSLPAPFGSSKSGPEDI